jgi:cysteine desulfurase
VRTIYLDNNATTQPADAVVDAMADAQRRLWANPSSVHRFGQQVRQRVELARAAVAKLLNCRDREIIFTSGGTESCNHALFGLLADPPATSRLASGPNDPAGAPARRVLITSRVEHAAVREPAEALAARGVTVLHLPTDDLGRVDAGGLPSLLEEHVGADAAALVSVQWANNETGVIQPVAALAEAVARRRAALREQRQRATLLLHVDATQAVGKLPVDVKAAGVDLLSFSAHKFHGPKGIGGLFARTGVRLRRQVHGGPQERDRRGGTENTAGMIGMAAAADLAGAFLADPSQRDTIRRLRDRFEQQVAADAPDAVVIGGGAGSDGRLWNTSNIAFPRMEAEAMLVGLSERGLCASAGAACSSGSLEPSPVLLAMGVPPEVAHGAVRFSLSRFTDAAEVDEAAGVVAAVMQRLRATLPAGV